MSDAPLTEQLNLDLTQALAQLDVLADALDNLVTNFSTGLEAALQQVTSGLTIEAPTVDASGITDTVTQALEDIPPTTLPIEADTGAAQDSITALDGEQLTLPVDADTASAQDSISALADEQPIAVPVDADTTDAQQALDDLTGRQVEVPVAADTTAAEAALDDLSEARTLDIAVDADTAAAQAEIDALNGQQLALSADVDTGDAAAAISALDATPIELQAEADTSSAEAAIESLGGTPVEVPVAADTTDAEAALDDLTGKQIEVPVSADTSDAEAALDDLTAFKAVEVTVDADTAAADAAIEELQGQQLTLFVAADVEAAADAIAALDETPLVVPVEADIDRLQAALDDIAVSPIEVPIEADASAASESIAALGETSGGTTGEVGGLEHAITGLEAAAGAAVGSTGELRAGIAGISAEAGVAVGATAAFTGFLAEVVPLAADAEAQNKRFESTFGTLAVAIREIDVGGLNISLEELGKQSGTTEANLEAAASKVGLLGKSAGASGDQIVGTTHNILALAGALSVQNPRLGDAAAVADKLNRALATGGRFAAQLGLSLNAADIKARAQEIAGLGNEVTRFDLVTAGSQLAVEQFGDTLGDTFKDGAQNAQVQLRALKVELEETLVAIGKPLLQPLVSDLQAFLPVAQALGNVFGSALRIILPLLQAFGPVLAVVAKALDGVAALLNAIPAPVLQVVAAFLALSVALRAIEVVQTLAALGAFNTLLGITAVSEAEATVATTVLGGAFDLLLGPIGLAIAAIGIIGTVLGVFGGHAKQATIDTTAYTEALFGTATAAQDLQNKLGGATTAIAEQLSKALTSGKDAEDLNDTIQKLGITFEDLAKGISGTDADWLKFIHNLEVQAETAGVSDDAIKQLLNSLRDQHDQIQATAAAQVLQLAASGQITQDQEEQARAYGRVNDALAGTENQTGSYLLVLQKATELAVANEKATVAQGIATGTLQKAFLDLKPAIADGTVTAASAQEIADQLGITVDDATAAIKSLTDAMNEFVDAGVAALPQAADAFDQFQSSVDRAFEAVVSAGGPSASSAIASATDSVASAQRAANEAVERAGESGASAIENAQKRLADAQQRELDARTLHDQRTQSQIDSAARAVAEAEDNLTQARQDAANRQAQAVRDGGQRVADAQASLDKAQADQAAKSKKAQDDLLFALDPQRVIDAENRNALAILSFQRNLATLLARGHADTVALLVAEGPAKGAQLAQSLVTDDAKAKALDAGVALANRTTAGYEQFLEAHKAELAGKVVTLADGTKITLTNAFTEAGKTAGHGLLQGVAAGLTDTQLANIPPGVRRAEGLAQHSVSTATAAIAAQAAEAGKAAAGAFTENYKVAAPAGTETKAVAPAISTNTPAPTAEASRSAETISTAFAGGLDLTSGLPGAFTLFEAGLAHQSNIAALAANLAGGRIGHAFITGLRDAITLGLTTLPQVTPQSLATPRTGAPGVLNTRPNTTPPLATSGGGAVHTTSTRSAEVNVTLHRTDPDPFQLAQEIGFVIG